MDKDHSIVDDEDEKSDATGGPVMGSDHVQVSEDERRGTPGGADESGVEAPEPDKPNLPHGPE